MTGPVSLTRAGLSSLPGGVAQPTYAHRDLGEGWAHIGVGAFHRGHQAVYLDDLCAQGVLDWGICGIGLRPEDRALHAAFLQQQGLYTVLARDGSKAEARVIGSHTRYLLALDDPESALAALCAANLRLVTLTITEAGYCCDDASGTFLPDHPEIVADLARPAAPRTAAGLLVAALARRRAHKLAPFSVLSCDNLEGNGTLTRRMLVGFAAQRDAELARFIEREVAFPSSMVDRITPVTRAVDHALLESQFGLSDQALVTCEPFRQWVVEDSFCAGRPPLEQVGVELTHDVAAYERVKLRLLNAGHSVLGYLGQLAGVEFIHELAQDADFRELLRGFMRHEITPLLTPLPGMNLIAYQDSVCARFANAALGDRVSRICMNGSAKLPKFLLASLREQLARGAAGPRTCLAIAGFCRYLTGVDERGNRHDVVDPLAAELRERALSGGKDPRPLLACRPVFGDDLPAHPEFVKQLSALLASLYEQGARATIRSVCKVAER